MQKSGNTFSIRDHMLRHKRSMHADRMESDELINEDDMNTSHGNEAIEHGEGDDTEDSSVDQQEDPWKLFIDGSANRNTKTK